jgi:hypothetical protein
LFAPNDNIKKVMEQPAIIDLSAAGACCHPFGSGQIDFYKFDFCFRPPLCASKVAN